MNQVEIFPGGNPVPQAYLVSVSRTESGIPFRRRKVFVVGRTPYPHAFWKVCGSESQDSLVGSAGIFVAFRIVDSMSKAFAAIHLGILFINEVELSLDCLLGSLDRKAFTASFDSRSQEPGFIPEVEIFSLGPVCPRILDSLRIRIQVFLS